MDVLEAMNVESFFGLDIAFAIDSTGSMMSYISGAKESIKEIMTQSKIRFKRFNADESLLKFGIVAYRDHPPQEYSFLTKKMQFSNYQEACIFLDSLTATGGGDPPEAVLDGLNEAVLNLQWRDMSEKILFLLLDNPAHGVRFGTSYDCPCGLNESTILSEMKHKGISFHIVRPKEDNFKLDKMIGIFRNYIEIDIMELEKHRKVIVNKERIMNEEMEMKIFSRSRHRDIRSKRNSKHIESDPISPRESRNGSKSPRTTEKRNRSRSRSRGMDVEMEFKESVKMKDDGRALNNTEKKRHHSSTTELISHDVEMNIESGIKDHISKVVIEKLNKYLNIDC